MPLYAQATWQQRFAEHRQALERRRGQGFEQARQAAVALAGRWPELRQVWLFGSLLGQGFREHSDLDRGPRIWSRSCGNGCCVATRRCWLSSVVLPEDLLELRDDLRRERLRLGRLVG